MLAMHYHYARVGMREHIINIPMQNTILMPKVSHPKGTMWDIEF